jgi:VanZ family protein
MSDDQSIRRDAPAVFSPDRMAARAPADRLPLYLAIVWVALTVYGSLYPLSEWQMADAPFAFLAWRWPRYWTGFDLAANIVVYIPTGFLFSLALRRLPWRWPGLGLAILLAAALSLAMETLQGGLPGRISSNLDFACNTVGAAMGSVFAFSIETRLRLWWRFSRARLISPASHVDFGLVLLGLWLLTLLSPETLLFGVGDLRQSFRGLPGITYDAETYQVMEEFVVISNFLAIGLFFGALTRGRWLAYWLAPVFFLLAASICSLSAATLAGNAAFMAWLTPGAKSGLAWAIPLLAIAFLLPRLGRLMGAALCLLVGAMLVNLAPINPYSETAVALWRQGHFLNFNGLTRWISTIWPFLALPYLMLAARKV